MVKFEAVKTHEIKELKEIYDPVKHEICRVHSYEFYKKLLTNQTIYSH